MIGILLCAGYGTRLYPLTRNTPKPLLPVGGRPMIEHILKKMEEIEGLKEVFLVTNAKFYEQFVRWKQSYIGTLSLTIINDGTTSDEDKLGPIGDLALAIEKGRIDGDVIIIAGDNLFGFSLRTMQQLFAKKKAPIVGFYDIKDKQKLVNKFGVGVLDKESRLIDFEEKPSKPKSTLCATCCYLFRTQDLQVIQTLAREKGTKANAGDMIPILMQQGPVYGFTFSEHWFDIGDKEQYEEADGMYAKKR